ncbi:hypothetical protein [uncultured Polaribacter sp.]|uniref:hypothetical protein n=1 Tax=uncultured Polaribacter sp. TaxID=174711 RepID=UPI002616608C|nr:hypothetical protein [uncultured Polaribacter sp.]
MKTQTAFRIDKTLLEMIKEKAKSSNRSLNNYIEHLLYKDVGNIPNKTTIDALEEVESTKELTSITNLNAYKEALLKSKN